ncbi:MAG: aminomethyl-transferring glycine dehydrogenase subunit GcvPA [Coriobacteriia bacterium]|nr:aminomethyl-transferring glycine dehydrogenase subunit GcvPA [Coriobacteriia bacterium]
MRYVPVSGEQREAMLRAVGAKSIEQLFQDIPSAVRLKRPLDLEKGMSEIDLARSLRELAEANKPATGFMNFAGAGVYDHYIPSVVDHILRKPEFFTAYTPYQSEASQGTLQAIWEFQSMICELTGMEVANASMYDGATAFVEAALMACRCTKRSRIVVAGSVHPEWAEVLYTYSRSGLFSMDVVGAEGGKLDVDQVREQLDAGVAALLVADPNFFGVFEDVCALGKAAHGVGAMLVCASNPILLSVTKTPGDAGADIVVGEGQPLGNPMSFGGPGLGFFACREKHLRQLPGRLVGKTVDAEGKTAYTLTLSTREQHIRRERATSNICSNHALNALAAGAYLSAVGSAGLTGIARACIAKAHYLRSRLIGTKRFSAPFDDAFGYEFALAYDGDAEELHSRLLDKGILAGVVIEQWQGPELMLFAVTEKRTKEEMDMFVAEVIEIAEAMEKAEQTEDTETTEAVEQ